MFQAGQLTSAHLPIPKPLWAASHPLSFEKIKEHIRVLSLSADRAGRQIVLVGTHTEVKKATPLGKAHTVTDRRFSDVHEPHFS